MQGVRLLILREDEDCMIPVWRRNAPSVYAYRMQTIELGFFNGVHVDV